MHFNHTIDLNNYKVVSFICEGNSGPVLKAEDNSTGELLAAKVSSTSLTPNDAVLYQKIIREVEILSRSKHPSILKFVGFSPKNFENGNYPVIMTEFMSNGSLHNILKLCDKGQLHFDDGVEWNSTRKLITIYGIANGMKYLHSHGIIHRNLDAANILMDSHLYPKITGLGVALVKNQRENNTELMPNPIYFAPEVFADQRYSEASDVYAFAILVYQIIINETPYKRYSPFNLLKKVEIGFRPPIREDVPAAYKSLIERCWADNPTERPTFDKIVEELKTNEEFITELVDENDYFDYIKYLDQCEQAFESDKHIIEIDD